MERESVSKMTVSSMARHGQHGARRLGAVLRLLTGPAVQNEHPSHTQIPHSADTVASLLPVGFAPRARVSAWALHG